MVSSILTRGFLIGEPAPEAQRMLLAETAGDQILSHPPIFLPWYADGHSKSIRRLS